MGTRLRSLLASGGAAVLVVVLVPGVPLAAQAASAEPASASVTAPEDSGHSSPMMGDGEHDGMMRDAVHGDMMGSPPAMGAGHDGSGCENMMAAPGHDNHMAHMAGKDNDRMMRDSSPHSMS